MADDGDGGGDDYRGGGGTDLSPTVVMMIWCAIDLVL